MAATSDKPVAVYGAIAANFIIAVTKFVAALLTRSSAMLSEEIHSLVDMGNQLLLLCGIKRSRRPPDEQHPFGHGKELYFWSLIVAMLLFGLGGGMSFYEGVRHLRHPSPLGDPTWNYVVLGIAAIAEGAAWWVALKELLRNRGERSLWRAVRESKDPAVYTVLAEDTAAILGLLVAFLGIFLGHRLGNPSYDGAASMVIGVLLAAVAVFLAYESRGLLIGESADAEVVQRVRQIVEAEPAVIRVAAPFTCISAPSRCCSTWMSSSVRIYRPQRLWLRWTA
jgi:cation diffusion facilitator family transporter